MSQEPDEFKLYPIQAINIGTRELYIKANRPPNPKFSLDGSDYQITVGYNDYDASEKRIQIAVRIEVGNVEKGDADQADNSTEEAPSETTPFDLRIEIVGFFQIDESSFPAERIYEWAKRNAVFIMYPFLREHVFALTARAGFNPMLLPLVEVPTIRIQPTSEAPSLEAQTENKQSAESLPTVEPTAQE